MDMNFRLGFEKTANKEELHKAKMEYVKKLLIPATLAFGAHGALFAPKAKKLMRALESGSRGALTGLIIGGAAHVKKNLEKASA